MRTELQACIASHRREMLQFARTLIAIPTENPPGSAYQACARVLRAKLRELGLKSEPRTTGACVQSYYGHGRRTLHFHGHFDVVPASTRRQFSPVVKNGSLFGRGSSDMKGGLVAMIYAVHAIQECGLKLRGRIGLTFVPDEETGGTHGSGALLRCGLLGKNSIGMLTPEPTGGVIWNASRGAISLRVIVKGKEAHVGLQHTGRNAFERMLAVTGSLMKLKAKVESRTTRFAIQPDAARHSILMLGGRSEGGTNFNLVPAECSFTVDRRTNPEEAVRAERTEILKLLDRAKSDGVDLAVEQIQLAEPSGTRQNHPLVRHLASSVREVIGKTPRCEMCPGLLETRFYAQQGIPALAFGPGLLTVSHGPREFVPVQNIHDCALIYALTAVKTLSA